MKVKSINWYIVEFYWTTEKRWYKLRLNYIGIVLTAIVLGIVIDIWLGIYD